MALFHVVRNVSSSKNSTKTKVFNSINNDVNQHLTGQKKYDFTNKREMDGTIEGEVEKLHILKVGNMHSLF